MDKTQHKNALTRIKLESNMKLNRRRENERGTENERETKIEQFALHGSPCAYLFSKIESFSWLHNASGSCSGSVSSKGWCEVQWLLVWDAFLGSRESGR